MQAWGSFDGTYMAAHLCNLYCYDYYVTFHFRMYRNICADIFVGLWKVAQVVRWSLCMNTVKHSLQMDRKWKEWRKKNVDMLNRLGKWMNK
jgi:hypothetical protein